MKKYHFEHEAPPAAFPNTGQLLTQTSPFTTVPSEDQWLNQAPPQTDELLTQTPSDASTSITRHGRDQPASFAASPPARESFTYASPYAAFSIENQRPQSEPSVFQTARQRSDRLFFISNAPTLHLGFGEATETASDWRTLTRLKTAQHPVLQTVTDWYAFAKRQTAQHTFGRLKNSRYRTASLVGAGLVALMLIALFAQSSLIHQPPGSIKTHSASSASQMASSTMDNANNAQQQTPAQQQAPTQQPAPTQQQTPVQQQAPPMNASRALVRISQLDSSEYASEYDFNIWGYSACSTAALTEVLDAYGHHYRIADVLKVESKLGEITPDQGLLENVGIARTAARFGFKTSWGNNWTLNRVLSNANAGHPVIVGWPPSRYPDGHIVVVTGGNASHVYLADSSTWNRRTISRSQFLQWWGGFAAVVTPK